MRAVRYDEELRLEIFRFREIVEPFPSHFHEHYVIGLIAGGGRKMICRGREYELVKGDVVLLAPGDDHACQQSSQDTFDYCGFHISAEEMRKWSGKTTGKQELPGFSKTVIRDQELSRRLAVLCGLTVEENAGLEKETAMLLFLTVLLERYGIFGGQEKEGSRPEIRHACDYLREHYQERVTLQEMCESAGVSKSTLLRAFAREKGVTPYRYLEAMRVNEARRLLEEGSAPVEAAGRTGFSDQSHLTNAFKMVMGVTPGSYRDIFLRKKETGKRG